MALALNITETANPPNTNTYGYDALDRLTSAALHATVYDYTYDAVGNPPHAQRRRHRHLRLRLHRQPHCFDHAELRAGEEFHARQQRPITVDGNNTHGYDMRGRMNRR